MIFYLLVLSFENWSWLGNFSTIKTICSTPEAVYVAGEGGIMKYDKLKEKWIPLPTGKEFPKDITLMGIDRRWGVLWVFSEQGLGEYHLLFKEYRNYVPPQKITPSALGITEEYVYLKSTTFIFKFNKTTKQWEHVKKLTLTNINWFPKDKVRDYPQLAPYYVVDERLNQYPIICVEKDYPYVWIGTNGGGVWSYNLLTFEKKSYKLGVPRREIRCMLKEDSIIWLGGDNWLCRWNYVTNEHVFFTEDYFYGIVPCKITSLVSDTSFLWIGASNGVFKFDKKQYTLSPFPITKPLPSSHILTLTFVSNELWIGTTCGLGRLKDGKVETIFKGSSVVGVEVYENTVWVAGGMGVFCFKNKEWKQVVDTFKILPHGVKKMIKIPNGLAFNTQFQGIILYQNKKWKKLPPLIGGDILVMECVNNQLYIGTEKGLSIYHLVEEHWKHYTQINSSITGIIVTPHFFYLGTPFGVVRFGGN